MISVEEARGRILAACQPLGAERVSLLEASGRTLAEPVLAERTLPPWDCSAMDGYAVRAGSVPDSLTLPLAAAGDAREGAAGRTPPPLAAGQATKVMTGAPLPAGADAVVMREHAHEEDGRVRFDARPAAFEHVRRAGEDVRAGQLVLERGAPIGPGEIGLLAALGRTLVAVHRRPRVAIVSTGDELCEPDRAPGPGQIVGSNAWALAAQVLAAGGLPQVLPIALDERAQIRDALVEALAADCVISSGGVSVGDFDFVKEVLLELGVEERFWRVRMKPGKPVVFGVRGRTLVFGLPGNPASSMVGFELFVRPALRALAGARELDRPRAKVVLEGRALGEVGRRHYVRAHVRREGGALLARANARQGSGMLRSMVGVNALLEIDETPAPLEPGAEVTAILLEAI